MKKGLIRVTALVMTAVMLSGCSMLSRLGRAVIRKEQELLSAVEQQVFGPEETAPEDTADAIHFSDMVYTRPDMGQIREKLETVKKLANAGDLDGTIDAISVFCEAYDRFYTDYSLADIHYSSDLTDSYWNGEYDYCETMSASMDAMTEEMYRALAASPLREELESEDNYGEGFFDQYDGDALWDETFTALMERESELISRYYALSGEALDMEMGSEAYYDFYAQDMAQLLVELIRVRQEIATYAGYDDYVSFANDYYYCRDYTPEDTERLLTFVREELVLMYRRMNATDPWSAVMEFSSEDQTLAFVRGVTRVLGGVPQQAFDHMEEAGLYDIDFSENKYNTSFEIFLPSYGVPFVFMNSECTHYDWLSLAHEFGHFCNDYACGGSYTGVDVSEVFSQSMEYLALCYGENTEALTRCKIADSLCTYIEQSCYASFEQQMYGLTGDNLSAEGLFRLYEKTALSYGFDAPGYDRREFVTVPHFFTNPMYVISYVVSNDAAMQIYQMELANPGSGKLCFEKNLDSEEAYFLAFVEQAGLQDPFSRERMDAVRDFFAEQFL